MSHQPPTPPSTNPGTSSNSLNASLKENRLQGVSRKEINEFLDAVSDAQACAEPGTLGELEVERNIIEHYNRGRMKGFDEAGYFIFSGVKVFEKEKKEEAVKKEKRTTEEVVFPRGY